MNKNNGFSYLLIFIFLFSSTLTSCQSNQEKKVIVEKDSIRKIIEEKDSLKIVVKNPDFKR
jgi:hypothetical protein